MMITRPAAPTATQRPSRSRHAVACCGALAVGLLATTDALASLSLELVADIAPGSQSTIFKCFAWHQNQLYFSARYGERNVELWTTDGTASGTRLVSDLNGGSMMDDIGDLNQIVSDGSLLFFPVFDRVYGTEPWVSDGTAAGTRRILETYSDDRDPYGYVLAAPGGAMYGIGDELWHSDGTPQGTKRFVSASTGGPEYVGTPTIVDGRYWFFGRTAQTGLELWTSDGTESGTHLVTDLNPGPGWGASGFAAPLSSGIVFLGSRTNFRYGIYAIGNDSNTPELLFEQPSPVYGATEWPRSNGRFAIFSAVDQGAGSPLMTTDGTVAGTRELVPGSLTTHMTLFDAAFDEHFAYFPLNDGNLWRTDGTDAGTIALTHFAPSADRVIRRIIPAGEFTLFGVATPLAYGQVLAALWLTDGTEAGTQLLLSRVDEAYSVDEMLTYVKGSYNNGRVYFTWIDEVYGLELHTIQLPEPGFAVALACAPIMKRRRNVARV